MKYDPAKHHRHSIRLDGYDYAANGAYFVTICIQNRLALLGQVRDGIMRLNPAGEMVEATWREILARCPTVRLGRFIVMPNHLHGIIILDTDHDAVELGTVIGTFKSNSTVAYARGVHAGIYAPFARRLWQRNYYERIIRNEREFDALSAYIVNNPASWQQDDLYTG